MIVDFQELALATAAVIPAATAVIAKAAAWAVRKELNGSAQRIRNIDTRTKGLEDGHQLLQARHAEITDRLMRIETIVDERTHRGSQH